MTVAFQDEPVLAVHKQQPIAMNLIGSGYYPPEKIPYIYNPEILMEDTVGKNVCLGLTGAYKIILHQWFLLCIPEKP